MKNQKRTERSASLYIISGCTLWGLIGLFSTFLANGGCNQPFSMMSTAGIFLIFVSVIILNK